MVGDSTMAVKKEDERPETGWGEMLTEYLDASVTFLNHAVNGRSSKSFRDEGRWQIVMEQLRPGDFVFIQFGHNDQKINDPARFTNPYSVYRHNLQRYVQDTRAQGATPVLLSSIVRRNFNPAGSLVDTHAPYPAVMRHLAGELNVDYVDLNTLSELLLLRLGEEASRDYFMHLPAGEHPNYPQGVEDNTHLNPKGARAIAGLVTDSLCTSKHPLSAHLRQCN